jgi:hypothetical protein
VRIFKKTCCLLFLGVQLFAAPKETVFLSIGMDTVGMVIPENIPFYLEQTLQNRGNHGYAFAEIILSRYERKNDSLYIHYRINSGETVNIDTVVFGDFSNAEVRRLNRIIRRDLTGLYHRERIRESIRRLQDLTWLRTESHHDISGKALRLYVNKVEDFRFDALVSYQSEAGGLVGQADLSWVNFLGLGRQADFFWYHPSARTNRVSVNWIEPYIFNTGFTAKIRFKQEHEDTLYVYRDSRFELVWQGRAGDIGVMVSREDIYTTTAGDVAGIDSGTRQVSALNFAMKKPLSPSWRITASTSAGIRTGEDTLQYPLEMDIRLNGSRVPFYIHGRSLGAWLISESSVADYQLRRLGGGDFLRGALFEQYRAQYFAGLTIEGGLNDGRIKAGVFGDMAILQGVEHPLFHAGTALSLPAGPSEMRILLGFDLRKPLSQGKLHVGWSF